MIFSLLMRFSIFLFNIFLTFSRIKSTICPPATFEFLIYCLKLVTPVPQELWVCNWLDRMFILINSILE